MQNVAEALGRQSQTKSDRKNNFKTKQLTNHDEPWGSQAVRHTQQKSYLHRLHTIWLQPPSFSIVALHFGHSYSQPHQIRKFLPFLWHFTLIALFISRFFLYIIPMLSALAHSLQKAPYKFTSIDRSTDWILNNHLTDSNKINSAEKVHNSIKTKHLSTLNTNSYILVSEYSDAQPKSSDCHCQGQLSSGSHALRCPQPRKVSMHRGQQNNLLK